MDEKSEARQRAVQIEVRESGVHGRGVYAAQFIPKARALSNTQANASPGKPLPTTNDPHTFNFGLENGDVINPEVGGNDARWINHSCDPNCETVEEDDRVFIDAIRDIQPGEELLYDYHMELDEPITESAKKKFACHCGASNCRGTMIDSRNPANRQNLSRLDE
jgi:Proteins containing SET domain